MKITKPDDVVGNPRLEVREARGHGRGSFDGEFGQRAYEPDEITRCKVSMWASMGLTNAHIGQLLCITAVTVANHFPVELKDGGALANGKVAQGLFDKAVAGDTACAIFYLKTRARWSEKASVGDRDNPLVIEGKTHSPAEVAIALAHRLRADKALENPTAH